MKPNANVVYAWETDHDDDEHDCEPEEPAPLAEEEFHEAEESHEQEQVSAVGLEIEVDPVNPMLFLTIISQLESLLKRWMTPRIRC